MVETVMHELHKLLVKQRGLLLIIFFIAISVVTQIMFFCKSEIKMSTMDKEYYDEYMSFFTGELSPEKEQCFLSEQSKINDAAEAKALIDSDLVSGKIASDDEYLNRYRKIEAVLNKTRAFDEIRRQYEYVLESPSDRFFVSNDGLPLLLSKDSIDYVLALLILTLTVVFFTNENASGMLDIMRTTANGGRKSAVSKFSIVVVISVLLTIVFAMVQLLIFAISYGFNNLNYPIQSLTYFSESKYSISIINSFFLSVIIKCIGFCSFSAIAALLAVSFKKMIIPVFAPITLLVIQEFSFTNNTLQYLLPTPTGLMRGVGYLRGDAFETINKGLTTEKLVKVFDEISIGQIAFVIFAAIVTITISFAVVLWCYDNERIKSHFCHKNCKIVVTILAVTLLGGCSSTKEAMTIHSPNIGENFRFVQNKDSIFRNDGTIFMQDKLSEKQAKLIRNPFAHAEEKKDIITMYAYGSSVYYLKEDAINCSINKILLDTYDETEIFKTDNSPKQVFLNAGYANNEVIYTGDSIRLFFLNDNNIFLVNNDEQVIMLNRKTKVQKTIIDEGVYNNNISFEGEVIYFVNYRLQLKSYTIASGSIETVTDLLTDKMHLMDGKIFFANISEQKKLYSISLDDKSILQLTDFPVGEIRSDNDFIYCTNKADNIRVYKLDYNGASVKKVSDDSVVSFAVFDGSDKIYCNVNMNGEIRTVSVNKK